MTQQVVWRGADLILDVQVQPRAAKDEIVGFHDGRVKIRITAPPVDGKANRHLADFLAQVFQVSKRDVVLLSGETGRAKRFRIKAPRHVPGFLEMPRDME